MEQPISIDELLGHSAWLRALAGALVNDAARADDLVQDTWFAALRSPPGRGVAPRQWLARVARNLASNARRSERRRGEHEARAAGEREDSSPEALAQEAEAQRVLAEAVARLAEPLRSVVVLRYFRGLDSRAIARELGVPDGTVRWRLKQALAELRAELDRRFEGRREAWSALLAPFARVEGAVASAAGLWIGAVLLVAGAGALWIPRWASSAHPGAATTTERVAIGDERDETREPGALTAVAAEPARTAAEPVDDTEEPTPLAGTADDAEVSGRVLVDGQPPRWIVELVLGPDPARSAGPSMPARAIPASGPARGDYRLLTLQPEEAGAFAFRGLPRDWRGTLQVLDHPFEGGRRGLRLDSATSGLELRVRSGPALSGRYVDARGEPLGGASALSELRVTSANGDGSNCRPFATTRDGSFRIPLSQDFDEALGEATLLLELDGRAYARTEIARVEIAAGLELGVVQAEPVRALEVHVRDSLGGPVAGAYAHVGPSFEPRGARPEDGVSQRRALTDERGVAVLAFAPERALELHVGALRHAPQVFTVQPGVAPEVVLERLAALEVTLHGVAADGARLRLTADGVPYVWDDFDGMAAESLAQYREHIAPARAQFELGASEPDKVRLGGHQLGFDARVDGRFLLVGLRPRLALTLEALDGEERVLAARSVSLEPGEWARVELELAP